jgi:hypothetical protein
MLRPACELCALITLASQKVLDGLHRVVPRKGAETLVAYHARERVLEDLATGAASVAHAHVENISLHSVYDTTKCTRDGDMLTAGGPMYCALPFHNQDTPDFAVSSSTTTAARRSPASGCVTYESMAFMSVGKKKYRNHSRFSRKRLVEAMQPGYLRRRVDPSASG